MRHVRGRSCLGHCMSGGHWASLPDTPAAAASHRVMFTSSWRYIVDLVVIVICLMTVLIVRTLQCPAEQVIRRRIPYSAAWLVVGF
jgi:hypothetical protein